MASISVPCPKCSVIVPRSSRHRNLQHQLVSTSKPNPSLLVGSSRISRLQGPNRITSHILRVQVPEVAFKSSSNSSLVETPDCKNAEVVKESAQAAVSDSDISAFMTEVSDLVKLVDSRDIVELQLKKMDCELIIRKKDALPQPPPTAPLAMMQHPPQAMLPPQSPLPNALPPPVPAGPPPLAPTQALALPPPMKGSKSSIPPLKCPMAGTFYRCPAPGEPPFVKVGDKVQKGQVVCIIEAMKLMNEIEADQSGTIVEILAEDGKPVSVDMPLLIIEP